MVATNNTPSGSITMQEKECEKWYHIVLYRP